MPALPDRMHAVQLTGHGGVEMLRYRTDVVRPSPRDDEVLIRVAAAGINNTDINTRIGWYSKSVVAATDATDTGNADTSDASWTGTPLTFPRIQGADVCGTIVATGAAVSAARIGQRVLVRSMMQVPDSDQPFDCWTLGSETDGGFAQYVTAPSRETHAVNSDWSDVELASVPCAYSTAENMVHRAGVGADRVLITGASGGVGSAAVQLAKRRGAHVIALCSPSKADAVAALGADQVVPRDADLVAALGPDSVDVVIDLVGGPQWPAFMAVLRRGGRYAVSGAIAGPLAQIDLRTLYLKDHTLFGCTWQPQEVFQNLIRYIEANEIRPVIAQTYPLRDIAQAQTDFLAKTHVGKLVLIPPQDTPQ